MTCVAIPSMRGAVALLALFAALACSDSREPLPLEISPAASEEPATAALLNFRMIATGSDHHTCGVDASGAGYCWGNNGSGQLGDGSLQARRRPSRVLGSLSLSEITTGYIHSCGLTTSGEAYCWGYNAYGELGAPGPWFSAAPIRAAAAYTFRSLTAGANFTCGLTTAGAAVCWGRDDFGQLGDRDSVGGATPRLVFGGLTFAVLGAGTQHTCGVAVGGAAYCWGGNSTGALGVGTKTGPDRCFFGHYACSRQPVAVVGTLQFSDVDAGSSHTCGVAAGGKAYCWGNNDEGQLGDGTLVQRLSPVAVESAALFEHVRTEALHSCAVTASGAAYCWGWNVSSALGVGSSATRVMRPAAVLGGLTFRAVSIGGDHTCGVTTTGAGYCWGDNYYGQLGINRTRSDVPFRPTPTRVAAPWQ